VEGPGADDENLEDRRRGAEDGLGDFVGAAASAASDLGGCDSCDGCDGCDGCNLFLLRVSILLALAAAVAPTARGRRGVLLLIRGYQRWLSRFTPPCPSTPSCSAFALDAVESLGPRRGLAVAARRVRRCGRPDHASAAQARDLEQRDTA
jgi:putative component of membrane protein insertase Oxa1/YidC/SpoIIIJ protein YidD